MNFMIFKKRAWGIANLSGGHCKPFGGPGVWGIANLSGAQVLGALQTFREPRGSRGFGGPVRTYTRTVAVAFLLRFVQWHTFCDMFVLPHVALD